MKSGSGEKYVNNRHIVAYSYGVFTVPDTETDKETDKKWVV